MIDRLLCNGSIPSHGCMSYGKPRCYGEGNIKELCCTCLEYDSCIKNEIQGAHWTSKSVTILMCIVQYLDERVWCDEISELVAGDEVSFQQDGSLQIYQYGKVLNYNSANLQATVQLACEDVVESNTITVSRSLLRKRKIVTD